MTEANVHPDGMNVGAVFSYPKDASDEMKVRAGADAGYAIARRAIADGYKLSGSDRFFVALPDPKNGIGRVAVHYATAPEPEPERMVPA